MVKAHFIVNPASRDFRCGKAWPGIKKRLIERGFEVTEHITERIGHGAEIAHQLRTDIESKNDDSPLVVAVGGDGIVHEVASGLRGSTIPLGQIPFGSGNDCCITHGISRDNLNQAIDVLVNGVDRSCGAWRLEGFAAPTLDAYPSPPSNHWDGEASNEGRTVRWVFLESDAGITSEISRAKLRRAKWIKGPKKYTYLGVTTIPFWPRRKIELKILQNGEPSIHDLTMMTVTTGETFGGGYRVVPGMHPTRENGSVVLAYRLSRLQMLSLMGPVKKGKHVGRWGIEQLDVNRISLRPIDQHGVPSDVPTGHSTFIQADGEPLLQLPASLEWHQNQIIFRGAKDVSWA